MTPTLEARLEHLEAFEAIRNLIADLARAFDGGPSAALLRPLFTDDALFRIDRYGDLAGAEAIASGVAANADAGFRWTLHYLVSPKILRQRGSDSAAVEFMLFEAATAASGKAYWIAGKYLAEVERQKEAWRFSRLELRADLISHYAQGWSEKPGNLANA
ncbi:nuclear transport factor 2 family protein [Achromobacter aegrifaciens]